MSAPTQSSRPEILLADDPAGRLDAVRRGLEEEGVPVRFVRGGQEILKALREGSYPIVAVPEAMEETHGERLLRKGVRRGEDLLPVLLREPGAGPPPIDLPPDTILLPIDKTAEIVSTLAGAYRQRQVSRALDQIIGETEPIRQIKQVVQQVAPTKLNVLLTGESGTGKELVARAIHDLSPRRDGPFIAVNAGALPEGVLESELFGHERGAFTGAHAARAGRFELANKGTLFLDEIGEMPTSIQVKLLRVLEESRFLRVGGMRNIEVDVRLVAATNIDLESAVEAGRFRRDLFFRLNVIHIDIPPLRERRDDIPHLVARFAAAVARENDLRPVRFAREAIDLLLSHHWPGNIRELRNLVEKVSVLYAGREIGPELIEETVGRRIRRGGNLPAVVSGPRDEGDRELLYRTLLALRAEVAEIKAHLAAGRAEQLGRAAGSEFASSAARELAAYSEMVEPIVTDVPETLEAGGGAAGAAGSGGGGAAASAFGGGPGARGDPPLTLAELERDAIARALQRTGGNRRRAARLLGIGERTLYRKIHEYRLEGRGAPR